MKRLFFGLVVLLTLAGCYGSEEDHSTFISGIASPDSTTLLFTYHVNVYRLAEGWAAEPDGGIPKYVADEMRIGLYDFNTATTRWLHVQETDREPGYPIEWYVGGFDGTTGWLHYGTKKFTLNAETGLLRDQGPMQQIQTTGELVSFSAATSTTATVTWYENSTAADGTVTREKQTRSLFLD